MTQFSTYFMMEAYHFIKLFDFLHKCTHILSCPFSNDDEYSLCMVCSDSFEQASNEFRSKNKNEYV